MADEHTPSEEAVERAAREYAPDLPAGAPGVAAMPANQYQRLRRMAFEAGYRAALVAAGPPDLAQHDRAVEAERLRATVEAALPTRVCPECGKTITVKKDGTLRHHMSTVPEWPGSPFNRRCAGSGAGPKDGER